MKFDLIAFDADDTLWHNEPLYEQAQEKLKKLLSSYVDGQTVERRLFEKETANIVYYGYGIKSFTLSMIETAIELTEGRITGAEIQKIIGLAKEMLTSEVQLVEHAEETIRELAKSYQLMVITKGDLLDQESKLSHSGIGGYVTTQAVIASEAKQSPSRKEEIASSQKTLLAMTRAEQLRGYFRYVEVVSEKAHTTYQALLAKYGIEPQRFLMVGNSLKSDILPVLALGGHAVYIPYHVTWAHEMIDHQRMEHDGYYELEHLGQLPQLIEQLSCS